MYVDLTSDPATLIDVNTVSSNTKIPAIVAVTSVVSLTNLVPLEATILSMFGKLISILLF
jgi:hypothetical protein